MKKLVTKHKRLIIIVLIALIIIGAAYYFTLGKPTGQNTDSDSGGDSGSGSNGASTIGRIGSSSSPSSSSNSSLPLKWEIKNSNTIALQKRLNLSITTCKRGSTLLEDGILGDQTVTAIKSFFPNIGTSVALNKQVSQTEYDIMINSKPGC